MSIEVSSELIHNYKVFQPYCEERLLFWNQLRIVQSGVLCISEVLVEFILYYIRSCSSI